MIREPNEDEFEALAEYGRAFWELTPYVHTGMPYNKEAVIDLLGVLLEEHYIRVKEAVDIRVKLLEGKIVGFIGCLVAPLVFNPSYLTATEIFFYVAPEHRGTIGKELITQAEWDLRDEGVEILSFGDMTSSKDMSKYYQDFGYYPTENTYSKVL